MHLYVEERHRADLRRAPPGVLDGELAMSYVLDSDDDRFEIQLYDPHREFRPAEASRLP